MKQNQRDTKQRKIVLETVRSRCDHPKADDICDSVNSIDSKISKGTVYRNLGILSDNGEITRVKVPGPDRFDGRLDLHYHIICTCCGKVVDAPLQYNPKFDEVVTQDSDFIISRHRTVFEGICPDCRKMQKAAENTAAENTEEE